MDAPVVVDASLPHVVRATLDSPSVNNSLREPVVESITQAIDLAEADPDTQVFVVAARGDTFCAGMPLGDPTSDDWRPDPTPAWTLITRLARSRLVTVAVVDGAAIGGGVGLAVACDQVIVGPRGSFRLTEVLLGLIPAIVLPVLAARIGVHRAFTLALTAEEVPAQQAVHIGLADRWGCDPGDELRRLLAQLRRADGATLQALKRYRAELYRSPLDNLDNPDQNSRAYHAFYERLNDPRTRQRLVDLYRHELI
ncbi:MAG: enoyl-CoA hydratase/isomerase family protein [Mycobacterium sp.]|nr:enoyl-CoA hydratase/isomerase family protein [Mycobacterium sp.]